MTFQSADAAEPLGQWECKAGQTVLVVAFLDCVCGLDLEVWLYEVHA